MNRLRICFAVFVAMMASSIANGQDFTVLHSFMFDQKDGYDAQGSLALSGSVLYGGTIVGGIGSQGVIFSIGTDGTGYSVLHSLDGQFPGTPTLDGATLYGMCMIGGANYSGSIFKMGTDGMGYTTHRFQAVTACILVGLRLARTRAVEI